MKNLPLAGMRLVVTLPPAQHFWGCALAIAEDCVTAIRELGAAVHEFDTTPFFLGDETTLTKQIEDLRTFRTDAVLSQPNAGYALLIKRKEWSRSAADLGNLFFDVLGLPTILNWDHVLPQAPRYLLERWPANPAESEVGLVEVLRTLMSHPRIYHFISDTGHISEMRKMGISQFDCDVDFVGPLSNDFGRFKRDSAAAQPEIDVAFFGNLYVAAAQDLRHEQHELMAVRERALAACMSDWRLAPYRAYTRELSALDEGVRTRLRLDAMESFYWRYLYEELSVVANGELRFRKLLACGRPVAYFGGFADSRSRQMVRDSGWTLHDEYLEYGTSLAAAYNRARVSLDIVNAPFIDGLNSTKLLSCFAAGGFMLTDRKPDLFTVLGPLADAVGFSSPEELAQKVDRYLTNGKERRELGQEIKEISDRKYSAAIFFRQAVPMALSCIRAR
jgi:hypothetical protein